MEFKGRSKGNESPLSARKTPAQLRSLILGPIGFLLAVSALGDSSSCPKCEVLCEVRTVSATRAKVGFWGALSGLGKTYKNVYRTETATEVIGIDIPGIGQDVDRMTQATYSSPAATIDMTCLAPGAISPGPDNISAVLVLTGSGSAATTGGGACNANWNGQNWSPSSTCYDGIVAFASHACWVVNGGGTTTPNDQTEILTKTAIGNSSCPNWSATDAKSETYTKTYSNLFSTPDLIAESRSVVEGRALPPAYAVGSGAASLKLCYLDLSCVATRMEYRFKIQTSEDYLYQLEWQEVSQFEDGTLETVEKNCKFSGNGSVVTTGNFATSPPEKPGVTYAANLRVKFKHKHDPGATPGTGTVGGTPGSGFSGGFGCSSCGGASSSGGQEFGVSSHSVGSGTGRPMPSALAGARPVTMEYDPSLSGGSDGRGEIYPRFRFSLGMQLGQGEVGEVSFARPAPSSLNYSPSILEFVPMAPGVEKILAQGLLRQVKSSLALMDVQSVNAYKFEVKFYPIAQVGIQNPTTLIYAVSGSPSVTYTIENPDASATVYNRLKISETRGASTKSYNYTYVEATKTWTLVMPDGVTSFLTERIPSPSGGPAELLTKAVYLPTGATSLQRRRRYELAADASGGSAAKLVEERLEDGATSQSVVYGYQLPPTWNTMTALVPLVGSMEHSDGRWEKFSWDHEDGSLSKHIRQVGNQPFSSGDDVNEVTLFDYTPHSTAGDDAAYEKFTPRTVTEKYKNYPVRIRFASLSQFERQAVEGVLPNSGFADVGNLRTIETFYSSGTWLNRPESMEFSDGTMTFWSYSLTGTDLTVTEKRGQPNPSKTAIDVGFEAIRVLNGAGRLKSETLKTVNAFIPTSHGLTLKSDVYGGFDSYLRPLNVVHLNGRSESQVYGCCALDSQTDQDGVTTTFGYDLNSRLVNVTRLGIQTIMALDSLGRTLVTYRKGTDNSQYPISQAQYNGLGKVVRETNALSKVTAHSETTVAGQRVHTTTYPDGATRIETYSQDGTLVSLTGTAVQPVRYVHDIGLDGGNNRMYTQQIKLDETGADLWETITTYYDPLGRSYKTVHADGATSLSYYNGLGQLWKMVDPDGVVTLYGYDGQGQQETVVLDMDRDGVYSPSEGSQDRLTRVVRDVVTKTVGSGSKVVHRTRTYQLDDKDPDNNDPSNTAPQELLVSTSESSADGLIQWDTAHSGPTQQTRFTWTAFSTGGNRYVTNVAMDGSYGLTWLINGRLNSVVEKGTTHAQLTSKVYAYDAHGRVSTITDARNGASVYQYNNSDQVTSSTSPLPGMGQSGLTTVTLYDNMGRPATVTQPDGTAVVTEYWPSGLVKKVSGSRTYASSYTYDAQGRMTSMTTWRTEAGALNPATTTWVYSQQRGWLVQKVHPGETDSTDDYAYTPGGRLQAKVLERGLAASHIYNNGGQLQTVNFTGGVDSPWSRTLTYDRRGRLASTSHRDGMIVTYSYNNLGQVTTEGYSGGVLSGFKVDRDYDSLFRPWHVYARQGVTTHKTATYSYQTTSSRLSRVDDGTFFADYSYLANSRLVSGVTVKTNLTTPSTVVTVSKVWDNLDRLGTISSVAQAGNTYSYGYSYNDANQRVQTRLADGSYWVYEYDRLGQVISGKRFWANGTPVPGQQYEYGFDDIGNRKTAANGGDSEGANLRSFTYAVNDANQYTSRQVPATLDVLGVARGAVTVKLDAGAAVPVSYTQGEYFRHEITARASDTVMAYPQVTVAVSGGSLQAGRVFVPVKNEVYTHDSDGNLMQDGRWTYHWDAENRLTNMVSVALPNSPPGTTPIRLEFRYDYLGRRIYKGVFTVASPNTPAKQERYVYDGWNVVLVLDGSSVVQRSFLWGMDLSGSVQGAGGVGGLVAIKEHIGTVGTHVPVYDGNGNVTALVTGQGGTSTITGTYEYGPFGESIRSSGTLAKNNPFRFSTKYQDDETDLLYYGYRFYNASTGRWPSRDPIEEEGGINLYGFVGNDSVNRFDLLGMASSTGTLSGLLDKIKGYVPASATVLYFDARLAVIPMLPPVGTVEVVVFFNGEVHRCTKKSGEKGFMFVGEVGLEVSAGIGTSIGGNSGVRPGNVNPYTGQRGYTRNGGRDAAPRPTVFDNGNTAETLTRHKSGVNFAAACQPCEDSLDLYASVGASGFISGGIGRFSVGAAFDYPIGSCSVLNGCKLTWQDGPTGSVVTGLGTGARIQVYGRGVAQGKVTAGKL